LYFIVEKEKQTERGGRKKEQKEGAQPI